MVKINQMYVPYINDLYFIKCMYPLHSLIRCCSYFYQVYKQETSGKLSPC